MGIKVVPAQEGASQDQAELAEQLLNLFVYQTASNEFYTAMRGDELVSEDVFYIVNSCGLKVKEV